jgi:hypothetical protein
VRFHDFHLAGYTVGKLGNEIVLDLINDSADGSREISRIKFADVTAYHFVHTGAAIIIDIAEISIAVLLSEVGDQLAEWWRQHGGYQYWNDDRTKYSTELQQNAYRAWKIESAVGFEGFVIAKSIAEA